MTGKETKNVTASVLAKLRNNSKSSGARFQQVLQLYAMERFLYRVSKSRHAQSAILKGALLLKTIGIPSARPTVDIDMLRKGKADHASLVALIKDCATLEVEADGLVLIADSVVAEDIAKDSEYKGTFKNRDTPIPADDVEALTPAFAERHRVQWNAFVRKIGETELGAAFGRIVDELKIFAMPALHSLTRGERLSKRWKAGRGWVTV